MSRTNYTCHHASTKIISISMTYKSLVEKNIKIANDSIITGAIEKDLQIWPQIEITAMAVFFSIYSQIYVYSASNWYQSAASWQHGPQICFETFNL